MTSNADGGRNTLRNMLVSGAGSLSAPLVNLIFIPIITRLYTPAEVGVWALMVGTAAIIGPVATMRFELAAVLEDDDLSAGRVLTLCFLWVAVFSLSSWVVLTALSPWLHQSAWGEALSGRLWVVPTLVLATGLKVTADGWSVRSRAFSLRAASLVALALGTNGGQVLAWYVGKRGADGLVFGSVLGASLSALILLLPLAYREFTRLGLFTAWGRLADTARRHRRFPMYSAPYTVLGTLRREGFKLVIGAWGTESMVGSVAFSWRLTNFPALMFSNGIRPVLFERAARAGGLADVMPFVKRLQITLGLAALPVLVAAEIWTEPIFAFAFGEQWLPAVPYARLLMVPAAFFVCTNWLDRLFDVAGRQDLLLRMEIVFSVLSLGGLAVGMWGFGSALVGVAIMAAVLTVYHVTFAVAAWRIAGKNPEGTAS